MTTFKRYITLIKRTGLIHIEHKITLLAQKIFNVLYTHAFPELTNQTEHEINIQDLKQLVPSIKNPKELRSTLKALCIPVEFNILHKDHGGEWGCFALLPEFTFPEGSPVITYSFSKKMVTFVTQEQLMYTKISLLLQQQYKGGKYGWNLYEFCLDYKQNIIQGGKAKTPQLSLVLLRSYLGVEDSLYPQFKTFNQWVLKPAIRDANKLNDLLITVELYKKAGKVYAVQFFIEDKVQPLEIPLLEDSQYKSILIDLGVTEMAVKEITGLYSDKQIKESIQVFRDKKTVNYPDKFINSALKENWVSKATENQRLSIISLEADKKEVKAKAEEEKEQKDIQRANDFVDEELYDESGRFERFNLCLDRMIPDVKECYEELDKPTRQAFREQVNNIFLPGPGFKEVRDIFSTKLMKFLEEIK